MRHALRIGWSWETGEKEGGWAGGEPEQGVAVGWGGVCVSGVSPGWQEVGRSSCLNQEEIRHRAVKV